MDADDLRRLAGETAFDVGTLEKDVALTWLIWGIYEDGSPLRDVLIFKGGTAIRKCISHEWRLSEDLDFTIVDDIDADALRDDFEAVFDRVEEESGFGFEFSQYHDKPYVILARVQYDGPLAQKNKIKVDISLDEKLVQDPEERPFDGEYDVPDCNVLMYTLDELLVEKIRSIIQRGYARDYYDVWRLLKEHEFDIEEIEELLVEKCRINEIDYEPEVIFDEDRLAEAEAHWETALARLTLNLPEFDIVIEELRQLLGFLQE